MLIKTYIVTSMVLLTWFSTLPSSTSPQKSSLIVLMSDRVVNATIKNKQRHNFCQGNHGLEYRCALNAAQHERMYYPQQDRGTKNGLKGIALAKRRVKVAQHTEYSRQLDHIANPRA